MYVGWRAFSGYGSLSKQFSLRLPDPAGVRELFITPSYAG